MTEAFPGFSKKPGNYLSSLTSLKVKAYCLTASTSRENFRLIQNSLLKGLVLAEKSPLYILRDVISSQFLLTVLHTNIENIDQHLATVD